MPSTEVSNLLRLLSGSKSFRRFLILLLAMAATSVLGQESVLTLAMVRYDQPPALMPAVARNNSAASRFGYEASTSHLRYPMTTLKLDHQNASGFPSDSHLEKQGGSNQGDLLRLVHKKMYADGRAGKWVDVAAGYGHICGVESGIWKNTTDLERPGCAYLKASFSF